MSSSVLVFALWQALIGGAPTGDMNEVLRLLPADTDSILYFDFGQILRSDLYKKQIEPALQKDLNQMPGGPALKAFTDKTGIHPPRDISKIVGGSGLPKGDRTTTSMVVVWGKFDPEKVNAAACELAEKLKEPLDLFQYEGMSAKLELSTAQAGKHKCLAVKVTFDGPPELARELERTGQMSLPFVYEGYATAVNSRFFVLGVKKNVIDALERVERNAAPVVRRKAITDTLARIEPNTVFSFYSDPKLYLKRFLPIQDPSAAKHIDAIDMMRFDLRIDADIGAALVLEMKDVDAAKDLKPMVDDLGELAKGMVTFLTLGDRRLEPLGEISQNLTINRKDNVITVQTTLSGKSIEKLVKNAGR